MTPEEYARATDLFSEIVALPVEQHDEWLRDKVGDDSKLRNFIQQMISQDANFDEDSKEIGVAGIPELEIPDTLGATSSRLEDQKTIAPTKTKSTKRLGHFELLEEIGRGAMGVVFKAKQNQPDRVVALKTIRAGQLASESDIKRFFNESQAAANLDHDGIVPVYEVGSEKGTHFYSMQFVDGQGLDEIIKSQTWERERLLQLMLCE